VTVDPPSPARLAPGTIVKVNARPVPEGVMAWVSGTVKIVGSPVAAFKPNPDGSWRFKTMIPPMATVPPGFYMIKIWGRTRAGDMIRTTVSYEVQ
jgi:hypothetical protein